MNKKNGKKVTGWTGFTLIELLIVVAIIAILAAIAVPNFIEAQTRAKVSRCKADMHSVGMAMECYYVDWNNIVPPGYPYYSTDFGAGEYPFMNCWTTVTWGQPLPEGHQDGPATWCMLGLTTPIAYIANIPTDLFMNTYNAQLSDAQWTSSIVMCGDMYCFRAGGAALAIQLGYDSTAPLFHDVKYCLYTVGPYLQFCWGPNSSISTNDPSQEQVLQLQPYDPSNGTVSEGNIAYMGRGYGFAGQK